MALTTGGVLSSHVAECASDLARSLVSLIEKESCKAAINKVDCEIRFYDIDHTTVLERYLVFAGWHGDARNSSHWGKESEKICVCELAFERKIHTAGTSCKGLECK